MTPGDVFLGDWLELPLRQLCTQSASRQTLMLVLWPFSKE